MDLIRLVEFDIRGTNPVNKFVGEKMPIEDKTCPYLIPNAAPFFDFPQTTIVYNQAGGELRRDIDYWLEGEFTPFCELSGKKVVTFVRLSPAVLADNEFTSITYQSIGANFVPRNSLKEWLLTLNVGKTPIPFHKVMSVPETLPPSLHWHSAKTEITDWYELTYFFHTLAAISSSMDQTLPGRAEASIQAAFQALFQQRDVLKNQLVNHDVNVYNPHGVTKHHLQLGNVDNFYTASVIQDLEGVRGDLFSTPMGVQEMVKSFVPNTDGIMHSGVIPVSQYGGLSYIPPNISGSFEAVGEAESYCFVMKEQNGDVVWLMSRTDGRVKGLYFSVIDPETKKLVNTGYKYEHPFLTSRGVVLDFIASTTTQSDVMLAGSTDTNKLYMVRLNGTLDPAKHTWSEVDTNPIRRTVSTAPTGVLNLKSLSNRFACQVMGENAYIFFWSANSTPSTVKTDIPYIEDSVYRYLSFLKVPLNQLGVSVLVTPVVQNLTFTDCHGVTHTNKDRWLWAEPVVIAGGKITKYVFDFAPHWDNPACPSRYQLIASEPVIGSDDNFFLKIASEITYRNDVNVGVVGSMEYIASFNTSIGVMTLVNNSSGTKSNTDVTGYSFFRSNTADGVYRTSTYKFFKNEFYTTSQTSFSYRYVKNIPLSLTREFFELNDFTSVQFKAKLVALPLLNGFSPKDFHPVVKDGYFFTSINPDNAHLTKHYYRKASGKLMERPGITNLSFNELLSQPLTNDVKEVKKNIMRGCVSVIVSAGQLDAFDVDVGDSALCIGSIPQYEGDPNDLSKDIVLFTSHELVENTPNILDIVPTKTITYPESIVERLKLEIETPSKIQPGDEVGVVITDPTGGQLTDRFGWLPVIVHITALISAELKAYHTVLIITPVYTNSVVTDYTVDRKAHSSFSYVISEFGKSGDFRHNDGRKTLYFIDGNTLRIRSSSGLMCSVTGTGAYATSDIRYSNIINKTIQTMSSIGTNNNTAGRFAFIPSVGLVFSIDARLYGYTCEVFQTPTGGVLLTSLYPETGWIVYLPDKVNLLINGTHYEVLGGSIDLRDVEQDPSNKTFYVYVTVQEDKPMYIFSTTKLRRSLKLLLAAVIVTGPTQILTIERRQPFVIGGYELSTEREANTIPVSSGVSQDEGSFVFLKESELVP